MLSENERRYNAKRAAAPHTGAAALLSCFYPFRAFREQFRQLSTALRRRSPGSLLLLLNRLHGGEQQNIADGGAVGEQHDQAIHAEAQAARGGQAVLQCVDIIVIHLSLAVGLNGLALGDLTLKAALLVDGGVQLAEGVAVLGAVDE